MNDTPSIRCILLIGTAPGIEGVKHGTITKMLNAGLVHHYVGVSAPAAALESDKELAAVLRELAAMLEAETVPNVPLD